MVFLCPYCGSKSVRVLFDDDTSLRRHMSVCPHHPHSKYVSDYDETASTGAVVLFLGLAALVTASFFVWLFW